MANRSNNYVAREELDVQGIRPAMNQFKNEVAAELGLTNYDAMDKGWLASRQNGYVGGNMTKKMVAFAEAQIRQQGSQIVASVTPVREIPQEIYQMNQLASQNMDQFVQVLQGIQNGAGFQQSQIQQ